MGIPEREQRERDRKLIWRINDWKLPNLWKRTDIRNRKHKRVPNKMIPKRAIPSYPVVKMGKVKEKILKTAREKQLISYKGNSIKIWTDFSAETLQARRKWQNIFKVLKGKNLQPGIFYMERLSLRIEREIKSFPDKQKSKEIITTKLVSKEMFKDFL